MLNLLLVQPVDSYGPNKFLPLAISYQWVYACTDSWVKDNWQVADVVIDKPNIKQYVRLLPKVDLAAFSCYVWNWSYNLTLATEIKKKYPDCKIVVGGPNIDKRDQNFFDKYPQIDYAITGEGELAFKALLKSFNGAPAQEKNFFDKQSAINTLPDRLDNLDEIPSPILSGFYDQIFELCKDRTTSNTLWQVTFETLRGCPYHCAFCDIGDSYWNKIKKFDLDRVKKEIDWMAERKIEYVSVCDSNWGMFDRDREITEYVIKKKKETGYPKFWDVTWAKSNSERIFEIAKIEKDAGTNLFKGITFAMQSFNENSLSATSRFNLKKDIVNLYFKKYKEENIPTYSELIWPMPNETVNSLMDGIQTLIDLGQKDFLMVHPLVLTPNAPMGQPEYRKNWQLDAAVVPLDTFYLKVEDPESYIVEYTEAVQATNSASYEDVIKGHLYAYVLITFFYYGWAHTIMEYLNKKYHYRHVDIAKDILEYFKNTNTVIGHEISETEKSLNAVFANKGFWGRAPTEHTDALWDYKGATSIVFDLNRDKLKIELKKFLFDVYNIDNGELLDLNELRCYDYRKTYPIKYTGSADIISDIFDINSNSIQFDHFNKTNVFLTPTEFYYTAYHYQRKRRYWQCIVQEIKE